MMSVPYVSGRGDVLAVKFRRIGDSEGPKYDSPSAQKAHLYNARVLAGGGPVVLVCEGELDVVRAWSLGVPAVATPGTTWLDHWPRCFSDFDRVLVVADHDAKEDGSDPGLKHAKAVVKAISRSELITPPAGLDLTDWINEYGVDAVKEGLGL